MDFYGYHGKQETFLKIVVYDPSYILRLRELLDSQIVGGRVFQCYEAHLNYFMQLFSDHNIYGINELSIIEFSFRRNLDPDLMGLFHKVSTLMARLADQGYDLVDIEAKHPSMFNGMEKVSSCYIEIDLSVNGILNSFAPQHDIADSNDEKSVDSEMEVENFDMGEHKLKFEVKITRALKEIWEDEVKRRELYGIQNMPEGIIDYSKNIESKQSPQKDPLWVNFIKKGSNLDLLIDMVKSSLRGEEKRQSNEIQICREVAENYKEVLATQKEKLI